MRLNDVYGGNYLKAEDLKGGTPLVTIESVDMKKFDDGAKLIIKFEGKDKSLVCNSTNASIIEEVTGEKDTDDWVGKTIRLQVKKVEFKGGLVPAIRVMMDDLPPRRTTTPPRQAEPEPEPEAQDDIPF